MVCPTVLFGGIHCTWDSTMFSLLLAIIISASLAQSNVADPGLQDSFGFGVGGAGSYQSHAPPSNGYGSHYYGYRTPIWPEYSYFGKHQGFGGFPQDVYLPGRVNPFSYPYYRSSSDPERMYIADQNARSSKSSLYKIYETSTNPTFRYHLMPYFETIETYPTPSYNTLKTSHRPTEPPGKLNVDSDPEKISKGNKTSDVLALETDGRTSLAPKGGETTAKREQGLQMTYLGYTSSSALRKVSQDTHKRSSNGVNQNGVPFYPLRTNRDPFSASSSSPILISPYRLADEQLRQSFGNYQQTSFSSVTPTRSLHQPNTAISHTPIMSVGSSHVRPVVSPYLNNYVRPPSGTQFSTRPTTTQFSTTPTTTQFSTRPTTTQFSTRPTTTQFSTRPTTTQFSAGMSSPVVSPFRYKSNTPLGNNQRLDSSLLYSPNPFRYSRTPIQDTQNGYYLFDIQPLKTFAKSARKNYNSGCEGIRPYGRIYSNLQSDGGMSMKQSDNKHQNSFNSAREWIVNPFRPAGWPT